MSAICVASRWRERNAALSAASTRWWEPPNLRSRGRTGHCRWAAVTAKETRISQDSIKWVDMAH
eukprot:297325-Amphidinium_carterae.1